MRKIAKYKYQTGGNTLSLYTPNDVVVNKDKSTKRQPAPPPKIDDLLPKVEAINFLNSYYESPEFKRKSGSDYGINLDNYRTGLNVYMPEIIDNDEVGSHSTTPNVIKRIAFKRGDIPTITINKRQGIDEGYDVYNEIFPHEYSHSTRILSSDDENKFIDRNKDDWARSFRAQYNTDPNASGGRSLSDWLTEFEGFSKRINHKIIPSENYADLNTLRWNLYNLGIYDARKGPMKLEDLQKAMSDPRLKDDKLFKRLLEAFTPENIVELNNTIALNNTQKNTVPMAKYGGKYQLGGSPTPLPLYVPKDTIKEGKKVSQRNAPTPVKTFDPEENFDLYPSNELSYPPHPNQPIDYLNSYYLGYEFKRKSGDDYKENMRNFNTGMKYRDIGVDNSSERSGYAYPPDAIRNRKIFHALGKSTMYINTDIKDRGTVNEVIPHEYSHTTRILSPGEEQKMISLITNPTVKSFLDKKPKGQGYTEYVYGEGQHDQDPNEQYADLNALRWILYKNGVYDVKKGPMTKEQFEKIKADSEISNSPQFKRLYDIYGDNLFLLNNEIASNNSTGRELETAQMGGNFFQPTNQFQSVFQPNFNSPQNPNPVDPMFQFQQQYPPQELNFQVPQMQARTIQGYYQPFIATANAAANWVANWKREQDYEDYYNQNSGLLPATTYLNKRQRFGDSGLPQAGLGMIVVNNTIDDREPNYFSPNVPVTDVQAPPNPNLITASDKGTPNAPIDGEQASFQFFVNKGLPNHIAAGIVGNLVVESANFDPDVIAGVRKGDNGKATGVAQWHPDRWSNVRSYLATQNLDPYTLAGQLEGVWFELNNTETNAYKKLLGAKDEMEAANLFNKYYERSADKTDTRAKRAKRFLKPFSEGGTYKVTDAAIPLLKKLGYEITILE